MTEFCMLKGSTLPRHSPPEALPGQAGDVVQC